jgi:hypothetical protein
MLLDQLPVPPQIPVPAVPVHVPLAARAGFTDKANATAAARMLGIKLRRDARTRTKEYLVFIGFGWRVLGLASCVVLFLSYELLPQESNHDKHKK